MKETLIQKTEFSSPFCWHSLHLIPKQGNFRSLKDVASFAEINTDILNINALIKRSGMSRKAYCVQHNFSETCVWLVAIVSLSEILWVFNDRDTGHADDNSILPSIKRRGSCNAVVNVVKRAGRVFLTTDHSNGTWISL